MKRNKKRALASGQPSQSKRSCFPPIEQERDGRSRLTEEDIRRVVAEELERAKRHWVEFIQSGLQSLKEIEQLMRSVENDFQNWKKAGELANIHSPHLGRANAESMAKNDARNLQLQLQTKLSLPLFTGKKLEGEGGACIKVALIDANTGDVVTSSPESSIKLEIVVLEGDFNKDDEDNWAQEEFENYVVKERQGKRPLLTGDLEVKLKGGVGKLGELTFTDNSSWNRSKKFRIGLKVASGYCGNARIREAKTDAFPVKEQRGEACMKHHPPKSDDEVWRLEKIAKDGKSHQKLSEAGIDKVEDFLLQLFTDSNKLREILGKSIKEKKWDSLVRHAKTCETKWKLYLYYSDGMRHGAVFNTDGQLMGLIKDRVFSATHRLSAQEKEHGDKIVKKALHNLNDVREFNGETFSGSMQKKSSTSFLSQVSEGQIEHLTPITRNMAPPILPTPVGREALPANGGFTAEGNSGSTAARLPIHPQSLNSQHATWNPIVDCLSQMEPSAYTNVQPSGSFPGNSDIAAAGLPKQLQSLNATWDHIIASFSPMEPSADTNVQPYGQPYGPPSSSLASNTEVDNTDWEDFLRD